MVGDVPFLGSCLLHEANGIHDGGVAPACFFEILFRGVLRFMDEEIDMFEEGDEILVWLEDFRGDGANLPMIVLKHFIVGDVGDRLFGCFYFESTG